MSLSIIQGKKELYHLGLNAVACEGLTFTNIKLANLQYGILMNYCRNVKAFDTKADVLPSCLCACTGLLQCIYRKAQGTEMPERNGWTYLLPGTL